MFMVSARSDSAELFMASVISMGTRLMRRAAKRRSFVTLGFLEAGGTREFGACSSSQFTEIGKGVNQVLCW